MIHKNDYLYLDFSFLKLSKSEFKSTECIYDDVIETLQWGGDGGRWVRVGYDIFSFCLHVLIWQKISLSSGSLQLRWFT